MWNFKYVNELFYILFQESSNENPCLVNCLSVIYFKESDTDFLWRTVCVTFDTESIYK